VWEDWESFRRYHTCDGSPRGTPGPTRAQAAAEKDENRPLIPHVLKRASRVCLFFWIVGLGLRTTAATLLNSDESPRRGRFDSASIFDSSERERTARGGHGVAPRVYDESRSAPSAQIALLALEGTASPRPGNALACLEEL